MALFMVAWCCAPAQVTYLAAFDKKKIHYGIQLGYTQSKFEDAYTDDDDVRQSLYGNTSYYTPGFHIAIIVPDLGLGKYFNVRFMPGITLINREFQYSWESSYAQSHPGLDLKRSVESVYIELPIDFKFRAFRYRNFRPYLTAGLSYGFDAASMRNNKNNTDQSIIRLNTNDLRYTAGVGFDFFMRYVKFAIELKMGFGMLDLKIDNEDLYDRSFDFINTRTFMVGFIFQG